MTPALAEGIHLWLWPRRGWGDAAKIAAELVELGVRGVIPQAGLGAPEWIAQHGDAFRAEGLQVTAGLGMDGAHSPAKIAEAIGRGLDVADAVMLDWESPRVWETSTGNAAASLIVDTVLAHRSDSVGRVTDCPWWAPLSTVDPHGQRHPTHPHAPTATFGRLAVGDRYVQAYGAPHDGASTRMLAWSRDPSQYPSLGSWAIRPAHQAYQRSMRDQVDTLMAERTVCLWDLQEMDGACRTALRAVKALRAGGYADVDAFQRVAGLVADGVVGPRTLAALGVT